MFSKSSTRSTVFIFFLILVSCSGGSDSTSISGKNLSLTVSGSRSFNPDIEHGAIDYYQVTISNEDLEDPIVERFAGDATSAKILNIPFGDNYVILVEAFNLNGLVIRRGQKEGIHIYPGKITSVDLAMNSVPIFTNITDKSFVSADRLQFEVFAEPESSVEILDITNTETPEKIVDETTGNAFVDTSVNVEGVYTVVPQKMDQGLYSFQVRDKETGEASTLTVTLTGSTLRPGVHLVSGGQIKKLGDELVMKSVGRPFFRPMTDRNREKGDLGQSTLIDVMKTIY